MQSELAIDKIVMDFEYTHLLALAALFLLLFLFYLSPFELSVNEDEDDE